MSLCKRWQIQKSQSEGDKDILRAGKGNLSDKCGHLPSSNHPQGKRRLAKQLCARTQTQIFAIFPTKKSFPLVYIGDVPSSRNRFFVDGSGGSASQRFCCQPVMTLLDTIGHLARLFNSLRPEAFLSGSFSRLECDLFSQASHSTGQHTNVQN